MFEMRLEGGKRFFFSAVSPSAFGRLVTLRVPGFCEADDFPGRCGDGTRGIWDVWPIDDQAREARFREHSLCRPVQLAERTAGAALISFLHRDERQEEALWVELYLSTTEIAKSGLSVLDDWVQILKSTKDDLNREAVLSLNLGDLAPAELDCFKSQKKLVVTDIALDVRPRAIQWRRDD